MMASLYENASDYDWLETTPFYNPFDNPVIKYVFVVAYASVAVFSILGNGGLLVVIARTRSLRTRTNFFVANLALCDMCVGLFCVMPTLSSFVRQVWVLGRIMCKLNYFINDMAYTASTLLLTTISLERYIVICYPVRARGWITFRRLKLCLLSIWLLSAVYNAPLLFIFDTHFFDSVNVTFCYPVSDKINMYALRLTNLVVWFTVPLAILIVVYSCLSRLLWRQLSITMATRYSIGSTSLNATQLSVGVMSVGGGGAVRYRRRQRVCSLSTIDDAKSSVSASVGVVDSRSVDNRAGMMSGGAATGGRLLTNSHTSDDITHHDTPQTTFPAEAMRQRAFTATVGMRQRAFTMGTHTAAVAMRQRAFTMGTHTAAVAKPHTWLRSATLQTHAQASADVTVQPACLYPTVIIANPLGNVQREFSEDVGSDGNESHAATSLHDPHTSSMLKNKLSLSIDTLKITERDYNATNLKILSAASMAPASSSETRLRQMSAVSQSSRNSEVWTPTPLVNRRHTQTLRFIVPIVVMFCVCVLPYHVNVLMVSHGNAVPMLFPPIVFLIKYLHCAVNPFLYALLSRNFRKIIFNKCNQVRQRYT